MRVAVLQSNYIPWKGYFDLLASVDEFIVYDDMQFTRRDWRNRNRIKTPQGLVWLTVPVRTKGRFTQPIRETEIDGADWIETHWRSLAANYRRAPNFEEVASLLRPLYDGHATISSLNVAILKAIVAYLRIPTRISDCGDYGLIEGKSERLLDLCRKAGADTYVSGPAAKDYLDEALFQRAGVAVEWFDYSGYPAYPQQWGDFQHAVSIVDLLFNCGPDAPRYMKFTGAVRRQT